jgi:hypothetical protein
MQHTAQCENQKHKHCVDSSLTRQHLTYRMAVQTSLCFIKRHAMKPYDGGGSMDPHIYLGTRQTTPATSPQVPHELEAGRTSGATSMLWTWQNLFPCQNLNHSLGHAAHSPDATMTDLSQLPSSLMLPNIQHSSSWIANSCSLSQNISHSFWNIQ